MSSDDNNNNNNNKIVNEQRWLATEMWKWQLKRLVRKKAG